MSTRERLTCGEYWLLVQAVEYKLPLPLLALSEGPPWNVATIDQSLNREGHGMTFDELAQSLHDLARIGWIEIAHRQQPGGSLDVDLPMIRTELSRRGNRFENDAFWIRSRRWQLSRRCEVDRKNRRSRRRSFPRPSSETVWSRWRSVCVMRPS